MTTESMTVGIIGLGAFGQALASIAMRNLNAERIGALHLWARRKEIVDAWHTPQTGIHATTNLAAVLKADLLIYALPAQVFRPFWVAHKADLPPATPLLITAKGLETNTGLTLPEVASDLGLPNPLALLSGPHLAKELCLHSPAVALIAGAPKLTERFTQVLATDTFALSTTTDVTGTAVAGALKNCFAVLSGILQAQQAPQNTLFSYLAVGLQEITKLARSLGAQPETTGLPPLIADYMLTTFSRDSRNTKAGLAIGHNQRLDGQPLAEGLATLKGALQRAEKEKIALPLLKAVKTCAENGGDFLPTYPLRTLAT